MVLTSIKPERSVTNAWTPKDTTTHQDHVIAHVLGATFLGYFVFDEALYILLDIGFVWTILLDGEMGLLPHPVAIGELEIDGIAKDEIKADIDLLLNESDPVEGLLRMQAPPSHCQIKDVSFLALGDRRRFIITGEDASLVIETSLATAEVQVMALNEEENTEGKSGDDRLEDVAQNEHEYLHQRLREELGREPTETELDDWLRQHTEGY
ncbi:MAG TPA: hypothetical protein VGN90_00325 [Pyrinomonadaceae bacterium]|nr:hypothetical protein [Pyrinomonadaceae bacterium]